MNRPKRSPKAVKMAHQLIKESTGEIILFVDRIKNLMRDCTGGEVFTMTNDIEDLIRKWANQKY